jgi:hypothetical protein
MIVWLWLCKIDGDIPKMSWRGSHFGSKEMLLVVEDYNTKRKYYNKLYETQWSLPDSFRQCTEITAMTGKRMFFGSKIGTILPGILLSSRILIFTHSTRH